jgi:hypothetical protein
MVDYYLGLDIGQSIDPSAIAIVQRLLPEGAKRPLFRCGHLERLPLASSYPKVVARVRQLLFQRPFLGRTELVVDYTGVGRPVNDLFVAEGLRPVRVTITAGSEALKADNGDWHVAKQVLISQVQTLLHDGRLHILESLAEAPILKAELEDFRAIVTDSGRWTFGARSGAHDDLILGLAIALWRAITRKPTMSVHPDVLRRSALVMRPGLVDNLRPSHDPFSVSPRVNAEGRIVDRWSGSR